MQGSFPAWLNLWFRGRCPLCDRTTAAELRQDCRRQIQACQSPSVQTWTGSLPVFAWGVYAGPLKRAIAALKYNHQFQLARPLGQWLAQAWLAQVPLASNLWVVPIPLHPGREQQRGYNQATLLAQSFCDYSGLALKRQGLVRVRATQPQFGLSAPERDRNLTSAFRVGDLGRAVTKPVLLLDDIYTTGATVRSAAATLQQSGMLVCGCVTVARAKLVASS